MKKKLSIIVPIYNAGKYLSNLLNSIIKQINKDIEIILIDDGSTDDSLQICNDYGKKCSNIIVKSIKNSGSGIARNTGIKMANGEYLFFPDSDDLVCDNAINVIMESIKEKPDYVVYSYYQQYRDDEKSQLIKLEDDQLNGEQLRKDYTQCLIPSSKIYLQGAPWNKVFKKSIIDDNNLEFPQLKRHQDDVFIINYISYANKIKIVSEPIYIYYQNMSFDESLKFPKNYFEIRKNVYYIFKENLEKWNSTLLSKKYVAFTYALSLKRMFMLTYSEKWKMDSRERNDYFKKILNDVSVNEIIEMLDNSLNDILLSIPKISNKKKILYKFYLNALSKKRIRMLKIISFILYRFGNNKTLLKMKG